MFCYHTEFVVFFLLFGPRPRSLAYRLHTQDSLENNDIVGNLTILY